MTLDDLIAIAVRAGRQTLVHYGKNVEVKEKADDSPVTLADVEAEEIILEHLAAIAPDIPVVAEEAVSRGEIPATASRFLLVDPVDGTRDFVDRTGDFTVNIGLVEDREPVLGIVHAPAFGRLWVGGRGLGAFEADVSGEKVSTLRRISVRPAPAAPTALTSRRHATAEAQRYFERHGITKVDRRGSSLKFCLLATGRADLYPRFGRNMEWDTCAGDAILREAGGLVTDLSGAPLLYGKRQREGDADYAHSGFLAWGDPSLADRLRVGVRRPPGQPVGSGQSGA